MLGREKEKQLPGQRLGQRTKNYRANQRGKQERRPLRVQAGRGTRASKGVRGEEDFCRGNWERTCAQLPSLAGACPACASHLVGETRTELRVPVDKLSSLGQTPWGQSRCSWPRAGVHSG